MAGRPERFLSIVWERGENLKALADELGDVVRGNRAAERLVALIHAELNDGAAQLAPYGYEWIDAPIKDARVRVKEYAPARQVAEALA